MNWGTEESFLKVKHVVECGDTIGYNEIMTIVKEDVISRVKSKIPSNFSDDVMQEIYLSVFKYLVNYVDAYCDCSASKRNAWLMKITNSKINDYWRAYYKYYEGANGNTLGTGRLLFSLTELESEKTGDSEAFGEYELAQFDSNLENVTDIVPDYFPFAEIEKICSLNSSPDRILAFLFYRYLFDKKRNAKSNQIVACLSEYTLGELYCIFLNTLSYNRTIKEELKKAMSNLYNALNQNTNTKYYNLYFCLTVKQLTDTIYLMNKKLAMGKGLSKED